MWSRAAFVLALIAGVAAPDTADARTSQPAKRETSKAGKKAKGKLNAKTSKKKRAKKKRKKQKKRVSRIPSKSTLRNVKNMPRGYEWPPSKQMLAAEKACSERLAEAGVTFKPAKREGRIVAPLTVEPDATGAIVLGGVAYRSKWRKGPHKLDCQLALTLQEFGPELVAAGVREVTFGSIFRWTNVRVNGQNKPMLSRHALGIAMDIVSFTDVEGRVAVVEGDYNAGDPLLHAVEAAVKDSGRFRTLLTPANDPASHHDHFHLEVAVDYTRQ